MDSASFENAGLSENDGGFDLETTNRNFANQMVEHLREEPVEHEKILKQISESDFDLQLNQMLYPEGSLKGYPDRVDMALNACEHIRMDIFDREHNRPVTEEAQQLRKQWETATQNHFKSIASQIDNILLQLIQIEDRDIEFLQKCFLNRGELLEFAKILHVETYLTETMFEKIFSFWQEHDVIERSADKTVGKEKPPSAIVDSWEKLTLYPMDADKMLKYRVDGKGNIKSVHCDTLKLAKGESDVLFVILKQKPVSKIRNYSKRSIETYLSGLRKKLSAYFGPKDNPLGRMAESPRFHIKPFASVATFPEYQQDDYKD